MTHPTSTSVALVPAFAAGRRRHPNGRGPQSPRPIAGSRVEVASGGRARRRTERRRRGLGAKNAVRSGRPLRRVWGRARPRAGGGRRARGASEAALGDGGRARRRRGRVRFKVGFGIGASSGTTRPESGGRGDGELRAKEAVFGVLANLGPARAMARSEMTRLYSEWWRVQGQGGWNWSRGEHRAGKAGVGAMASSGPARPELEEWQVRPG